MKNWRNTIVSPKATIREALEKLNKGSLQVVLVLDGDERLKGTITDGDIRRALLANMDMSEPVGRIMQTKCTTASVEDSDARILELMQRGEFRHVPVLDDKGRVVNLKVLLEMLQERRRENWVVLMAGGLGSRLRPLTNDCPKPMLEVGGKPILQTIMEGFIGYGFHRFFLSVNYKAEMIEEYFGDGSRFNVDISYLREDTKLGTAGSLSLFPERPDKTFLVMNGDLLTQVNFERMLNFHRKHGATATMGIREYDVQIPFGVVETKDHRLVGLTEKPVHKFFVNAGVYAIEPDALDLMPKNQPMDMPELFEEVLAAKLEASVFPIHEYWMDIGRHGDLDRANGEYTDHF